MYLLKMSENLKTLGFAILILFFIWDYYKKDQQVHALKETIFLQDDAIKSQNILINFYKLKFQQEDGYQQPFYPTNKFLPLKPI